jgi:purine-binding chemotaxis protein CheW
MAAATTDVTQYLTFLLGDETFALDIAKVREVLDFTPVTKLPLNPEFLRGVINLRGSVVPVADLRCRLGMPLTERPANTCVIIVETEVDGETTLLGALVDSVQEVVELGADAIEPAPRIGTNLNTEFLKGMGKRNDRFVIVLDIERVFSGDGMSPALTAGAQQVN